jgi:hypothetical protein
MAVDWVEELGRMHHMHVYLNISAIIPAISPSVPANVGLIVPCSFMENKWTMLNKRILSLSN